MSTTHPPGDEPTYPRNVCAVQRISDGAFYQENSEHGSGWTKRIRQSWTYREANIVVRTLFELGYQPIGSVRVVELHALTQGRK